MSGHSIDLFKDQIKENSNLFDHYRKKSSSFSWLRTLVFLLTILAGYYYFTTDIFYFGVIAGCTLVSFFVLVSIQRKHQYLADLHEKKIEILNEEIKRDQLELNLFDDGLRFSEKNHPNADDLDLFGPHSLFQLLNRCEIEDSKKLLGLWLKNRAEKPTIKARQTAIGEYIKDLSWLTNFSATVRLAVEKRRKTDPQVSAEDIFQWSYRTLDINTKKRKILAVIFTCFAIINIGYVFATDLPYFFALPALLLNMVFMGIANKQLAVASSGIDGSKSVLDSYEKAIEEIVNRSFNSALNVQLQEKLTSTNALNEIKGINALVHRIGNRSNMLYWLLNVVFLLDVNLLADLEKWRRKNQQHVSTWLASVHEIECLVSLSGFSLTRPNYTFPEISDASFHFEAANLGHPLISEIEKIRNDYIIEGAGSVDILTGSNMSGKSTFQRTIGVNMVLGQLGAPCDAKSISISSCLVFTSMRTKDNLEEHTSSFYAELKRIRQLLDLVEKGQSVFFLLDEILKGTNSEDRHIGAVALATQLNKKNAYGIISTHDLKLSKVAEEQQNIRNYSFNSTIDGEKIVFDYKLTEGVCKSFNASQLMRNMGIIPS